MLVMVARLSRRARTIPRRSPFNECDAGAFHGDIGAGAHGDAHLGLGESRRVVDAVAGHGHDAAFGLESLDILGLLIGEHLGSNFIQAEPSGDGLGRGAVVAGEHDQRGCPRVAGPRCVDGRFLDRIGDAEQTRRAAVDHDEDDSLAVAPQVVRLCSQGARLDAQLLEQRPVAERPRSDRRPDRGRPGPVRDWNACGRGEVEPLSRAAATVAAASGCSLACLEAGGQAEQFGFIETGRRHNRRPAAACPR